MPLVTGDPARARSVIGRAAALWTYLDRWATFVEGFAHVLEQDPEWPSAGSKLVWSRSRAGADG